MTVKTILPPCLASGLVAALGGSALGLNPFAGFTLGYWGALIFTVTRAAVRAPPD